MNPAITEVIKIVMVCVGWIGGLGLFVWWRDKGMHKSSIPLSTTEQISEAA